MERGYILFKMPIGEKEWLSHMPKERQVTVNIVVHRNPKSKYGDTVHLSVGLGRLWKSNQELLTYGSYTALENSDIWGKKIKVFPGLQYWVKLDNINGVAECREDGEINFHRMFNERSDTTIHLTDGIGGCCKA